MLEKSKSGRAVRKDSLERKIGIERLEAALHELYGEEKLSTTQTAIKLSERFGIHVPNCKVYWWVERLGIVRGKSEAVSIRRAVDNPDQKLSPEVLSVMDGMILGDGYLEPNDRGDKARICIGSVHRECAMYYQFRLSDVGATMPFFTPAEGDRKGRGMWEVQTPFFYSLSEHRSRWYPDGIKHVPADVRLDRDALLLWYLGDGSISAIRESNSRELYFSTNSFDRVEIRERLCDRMEAMHGIRTSRITDDNRLFLDAPSIPVFLELVGPKSPVKCFAYKFELEEWRLWTPMKKVAEILDLDYHRLASWVKTGKVAHSRSPGGKKVMFAEGEFAVLRARLESGELSREKGARSRRRAAKEMPERA